MPLDKRPIEGDETAIKGKKWKELKLDEAIERYKKMDDDKIETSSRAISMEHKSILTDLKWEYKYKGINKSDLLGATITLGASRMETFVNESKDIYLNLRKVDNAYVNEIIRSEPRYFSVPTKYPYPLNTYKWALGIISDLSDIFRYGIHSITSVAFFYGLKEDTDILSTQDYKDMVKTGVLKFQERINGRMAVYNMLLQMNKGITQNDN